MASIRLEMAKWTARRARRTCQPRPDGLDHLRSAGQDLNVAHDLASVPGEKPPLPRVLAIANQKGGVGKTTTAMNLGAALAELGYRVLVVDLDPQGNATTGLGVNARNFDRSMYDVILHDVPIEDCIEPTNLAQPLRRAGDHRPRRGGDRAGARVQPGATAQRADRTASSADFDFVLIDCPPSLGLLTLNAPGGGAGGRSSRSSASTTPSRASANCSQRRPGPGQPQPEPRGDDDHSDHVRRPHPLGGPGGCRGARPLRGPGLP